MKHTWRWFGPADIVSISDIEQAGAHGVVSALHHIPSGHIWPEDEISKRIQEIGTRPDGTASALTWDVVESLPVSEDIKRRDGNWQQHIANYKSSLRNLSRAGLKVICYNFMPVLDWTRTDLAWRLPNGSTCMRFDHIDFAVFDLLILKRPGAEADFDAATQTLAQNRFAAMSDSEKDALTANIIKGLPGANQTLTFATFKDHLDSYRGVSAADLKANLFAFLNEIIPVAEDLGLRLCCHPDDPPFGLLGLPRIMSTEADYKQLVDALDSTANGITLCSGSLGVHPENDLAGMMRRLGHRVHFLHLRNVRREGEAFPGSFHEAAHLEGNTDMVALIQAVLEEERARKESGRPDHQIPMRPDHGHQIGDDFRRTAQPGYPYVGRLRGLAELRGIEAALTGLNGHGGEIA
ncbi:mannonate dehydratase [Cognatishimia maritima]|uniref:Mannonate dehydratase n=1 Tax=Cognatishimia maritima TaxID=870908 RepID=A0A1M5QUR1_9RHOB|nr:mannonate dehydratase [Cognatishimia maritima]SHH17897.1 D-mannonate dehydratase [Cognatishimia maritima]